MNPAGQGMMNPPGRGLGPLPLGPGQRRLGGNGGGGPVGQAQAAKLDVGRQLRRRVDKGALTGAQAQKTAQERQTLASAFGSDWRKQVFGSVGKMRELRQALAENPNDPKLPAQNQRLMKRRSSMMQAAREKLGAGAGPAGRQQQAARRGAAVGQRQPVGGRRRARRVNPVGRGMMNPAGRGY